MLPRRTLLHLIAPLIAATTLAACADLLASDSLPIRYYVLSADDDADAAALPSAGHAPTIGVARTQLAKYLERSEIVTQDGPNQISLARFDQWAAPLDRQISTVLAENLTALVPSDRVMLLPASPAVALSYRVETEIVRFERDDDGSVTLIARWSVFDGGGRNELAFGRSTIRKPVAVSSMPVPSNGGGEPTISPAAYDAIAAAMSVALADLSREIADAIRLQGTPSSRLPPTG